MRKVLLVLFLMASASSLYGQTATPTPTATNTPTPTPTITPVLIDSTLPAYVLVANGTTDSATSVFIPGACWNMTFYAPAAVDGTVTVQVTDAPYNASPVWRALQYPAGTDVALAASKAVTVPTFCSAGFRIHESTTAAADRQFYVTGQRLPR